MRTLCVLAMLFVALRWTQPALAQSDGEDTILFRMYQQSWVSNPVSGNVFPPPGTPSSDIYPGIFNISVSGQLWVEEIQVQESEHAFSARYWWAMNYGDNRTAGIIAETNTSETDCSQLCSSHIGFVLNMWGGNACCTNVYMPNSYFQNMMNGSLQNLPNDYTVFPVPGSNRVQYWTRGTSKFSTSFDYGAFPFDRQRLQFQIVNEFLPEVDEYEGIQLMSPSAVIPLMGNFKQDVDALQEFNIKGWRVISKYAQLAAFSGRTPSKSATINGTGLSNLQDKLKPGIVFSVEVQRIATGFWIIGLVLPNLLLILFGILSFLLPGRDLKTRMEILTGMFLAILLLQYSVRGYLPGVQAVIPPYIVLVVSYVYLFLIAMTFLLNHSMEHLHMSNTTKIKVLQATKRRIAFQRGQLRDLLKQKTIARTMLHMSSRNASKEISREMQDFANLVARYNKQIADLQSPWHLDSDNTFLDWLLLGRWTSAVTRWYLCLGVPQAEDYCKALAAKVEKVSIVAIVSTYTLVTFLTYFLSYVAHPGNPRS